MASPSRTTRERKRLMANERYEIVPNQFWRMKAYEP
jgi:hypothetical protein